MNTIIGIDLGTSTTEAAVLRDGSPELILNFDKEKVTPSVVGMDEAGNLIVGEPALARQVLAPENTVLEIKRKMGSRERCVWETLPLHRRKSVPRFFLMCEGLPVCVWEKTFPGQ